MQVATSVLYNKKKQLMASEIPTQSEITLVWEELEPFPPLENISEGEDELSDVSIFVSDHDVLDCSICCEPLKPPIFQVISSPYLSITISRGNLDHMLPTNLNYLIQVIKYY